MITVPDSSARSRSGPRHMRRRPFRADIPDSLLPQGRTLRLDARQALADRPSSPDPAPAVVVKATKAREISHDRKRLVALTFVILVSLSIPALALSLIFAG